jgi:hypothetical protein
MPEIISQLKLFLKNPNTLNENSKTTLQKFKSIFDLLVIVLPFVVLLFISLQFI